MSKRGPATLPNRDRDVRGASPAPDRQRRRYIGFFQTAFAGYLAQAASFEHLRAVITRCVADARGLAGVIRDSCSAAFKAGCLSGASYRVLLADLAELIARFPDAGASGQSATIGNQSAVGRVLRNRFEIEARIGAGGVSVLYRATDRHRRAAGFADAAVVVKLLGPAHRNCPDALRSLQCEARNAQRLTHANIRTVYDLDRCSSDFFITMEWLRGESLANRLDRTGSLPMSATVAGKILSGIAAGLDHAHDQGIVHGDVKPGNVFLTTDGQVKLLDFGQAIMLDPGARAGPLGRRAISPAYASCELHEYSRPEIRDDVFSLAVMAYRMLAGVRPFGRHTPIEAERTRLRPRRPDALSGRQWALLQHGLAFRRGERPQSVRVFVEGLLQVAGPEGARRRSPLHVAA